MKGLYRALPTPLKNDRSPPHPPPPTARARCALPMRVFICLQILCRTSITEFWRLGLPCLTETGETMAGWYAPLELSELHEDDLNPEQAEGVHPVALRVCAQRRNETALPPQHLHITVPSFAADSRAMQMLRKHRAMRILQRWVQMWYARLCPKVAPYNGRGM